MVERTEFVVTFTAKDKGLLGQLDAAGKKGQESGKKIESGFKRASRAAKSLVAGPLQLLRSKLLGVGAALAATFAVRGALADAQKFGRALAEVGTIAGVSSDELKELGNQTRDIATKLGLDEVDTAKGLYQTLSAGITDTADALLVLEQASRLAVAGVTSTAQAVDLLTSLINAYGLEAEDAAALSDTLFQTVRLGKTTTEELAASIGQIAPIASSVGVGVEQLTAALATLTLSGLSTSEAATQVRAVITALGKKGKEIAEVFEGAGKSFQFADIATRGLVPILTDLREITNDNTEELIALFGRMEGVNGALNLTGANAATFARVLYDVERATGSVSDALTVQFGSAALRVDAQINAIRQGMAGLAGAFIEGFGGDAPETVEEFGDQLLRTRELIESLNDEFKFAGDLVFKLAATFGLAAEGFASFFENTEDDAAASRAALEANLQFARAFASESSALGRAAAARVADLEAKIAAVDFFAAQKKQIEGMRAAIRAVKAEAAIEFRGVESSAEPPPLFDDFGLPTNQGARDAIIQKSKDDLAAASALAKGARDELFGAEYLTLISAVTNNLAAQTEAIELQAAAERERIEQLRLTGELTGEQAGKLLALVDIIREDAIATLDDADAKRSLRDIQLDLNAQLGAFRERIAELGFSTPEITAKLREMAAAAKASDEEGFARAEAGLAKLIERGQGFGNSLVRGLSKGQDTAEQLGESLGSDLGGAFNQLGADLAAGEQGFRAFAETAVRAIGKIIAKFIALRVIQSIFGFGSSPAVGEGDNFGGSLNFNPNNKKANGGTIAFANGGVLGKSFSTGAFPTGGVVSDPTLALFGDQSNKFKGEAFVPIPADAKGIPVDFRGGFPGGGGDSGPMVVNVNMSIDAIDSRSLNERLSERKTRDLMVGVVSDAMRRNSGVREDVRSIARG